MSRHAHGQVLEGSSASSSGNVSSENRTSDTAQDRGAGVQEACRPDRPKYYRQVCIARKSLPCFLPWIIRLEQRAGAGRAVQTGRLSVAVRIGFSAFVPPIPGASARISEHAFVAPAGVIMKEGHHGILFFLQLTPCSACLPIQLERISAVPHLS